MTILDHLSGILKAQFAALGLDPMLAVVTPSRRPELGQFQCNGAMAAAKQLGRKPLDLAQTIADGLTADPAASFLSVTVAPPGFVNLSLSDDFLTRWIAGQGQDPTFGFRVASPRTVVLDYGGPNVAKAMHVGHLRAAIIGDTLRRLHILAGDRTIGDTHLGDWGLQMGMLISEMAIRQPDLPYFDPQKTGGYPATSPISLDDLATLYVEAATACKADPVRMEAARAATAELQNGRPGYVALWRHFVTISVSAIKSEYTQLRVLFDWWKGESDVHDLIGPLIDRLDQLHLTEKDGGALIVRVAKPDDKVEIPPLILVKKDGAVMYGTTDLATIEDRRRTVDPDLILYVVDQRQHLHFEQVFRTARLAGINGKAELIHVGFGTMNGPDGKPFKTREGGVVRLTDLITQITEEAEKRMQEAGLARDVDAETRHKIARQVGVAALRFADLSNHRLTNYIFQIDKFSRFEGKTGPYLLYAGVRIKSMIRKAADAGVMAGAILPGGTAEERLLMLSLTLAPFWLRGAYDGQAPNLICEGAFELAQRFNSFYQACPILSESDAARQSSRLALAQLTLRQLELYTDLLGIEIPERM